MASEALAAPARKGALLGKNRGRLYYAAIVALFAVGFLVRLYGLGSVLGGVQQDEASVGYDAWAILNHGIDRNGVWMPAYLVAWGSGQNAGYAYLLMPFIKLFGLNLVTLRLPMALAGCASMWALYTILRRSGNKRLVLIGMFLFAICPWHIIKSRWAVESNLFPEMLMWGVALLCAGQAGGKKRWYYIAFAVFGLSTWSYAVSYIQLPLFLGAVAAVMLWKKMLPPLHIAGCFAALVAFAWPIILFALITLFGWGSIELPFLTIPQMPFPRSGDFALFSDTPVKDIIVNVKELCGLLVSQNDGMLESVVSGYGMIYLTGMPFAVIGVLRFILPRRWGGRYNSLSKAGGAAQGRAEALNIPGGWIFVPLALSGFFVSLTVYPNIVHTSALWMSLAWFWIIGVYDVC